MSALARWLARTCWWYMLMLMRRPWMKKAQRNWVHVLPKGMQEKALESLKRQNSFARRYGLRILIVCFNIMLASFAITICLRIGLTMWEQGYFTLPEHLK